ncbi:ABC transporter permease [Deinococcus rubellus]|uniref:ABC transporter permease n=1 Tax=Deinococcus rubellus TaxID=1889240 RepID=UPI0031E51C63
MFKSRAWYKFSRNPLSTVGAAVVALVVLAALFAAQITPYPQVAGAFTDFANASQPPSAAHWFGTDTIGRDILTRSIFGYRVSLLLGLVVLGIAVPIGVLLGLLAGYLGGRTEAIIMRITDVFIAIPPLVLALAIMGFLQPTLWNAMLAMSAMWWPWYTRLVYSQARILKHEGYISAAKVLGAGTGHILFREILPNCLPSILTKITLDMGFAILLGASLSFLGLGVQPPTPDLGGMVAEGAKYLPDQWWIAIFPSLAILLVVIAFNLMGDGVRDMLDAEV